MARKVNPNKMSPAELEEYVRNLPDEQPPKMSSALWLLAVAVVGVIGFVLKLQMQDYGAMTWALLGGAILSVLGAIYIIYRVTHFNKS